MYIILYMFKRAGRAFCARIPPTAILKSDSSLHAMRGLVRGPGEVCKYAWLRAMEDIILYYKRMKRAPERKGFPLTVSCGLLMRASRVLYRLLYTIRMKPALGYRNSSVNLRESSLTATADAACASGTTTTYMIIYCVGVCMDRRTRRPNAYPSWSLARYHQNRNAVYWSWCILVQTCTLAPCKSCCGYGISAETYYDGTHT